MTLVVDTATDRVVGLHRVGPDQGGRGIRHHAGTGGLATLAAQSAASI